MDSTQRQTGSDRADIQVTEAAGPGVLAGYRVLVIEDDYFLADEIATALALAGADVVGPMATLAGALASLRTRVDAAVLDINLRGEPVWPLAEALLAQGVAFVFATSYGPETMPSAYAAVPRWMKPLDISRFIRALSALIGSDAERARCKPALTPQ